MCVRRNYVLELINVSLVINNGKNNIKPECGYMKIQWYEDGSSLAAR